MGKGKAEGLTEYQQTLVDEMNMVKRLRRMGACHITVGRISVVFNSPEQKGSARVTDMTVDASAEVNRLQSQVDRDKLMFWSAG